MLVFEWREIDNTFHDETTVTASYTIDTMRTLLGKLSVNASIHFEVSTNSNIARRDVCYWDQKVSSYGSLASGFTFNVDANSNN